jgi:hypothetical protein
VLTGLLLAVHPLTCATAGAPVDSGVHRLFVERGHLCGWSGRPRVWICEASTPYTSHRTPHSSFLTPHTVRFTPYRTPSLSSRNKNRTWSTLYTTGVVYDRRKQPATAKRAHLRVHPITSCIACLLWTDYHKCSQAVHRYPFFRPLALLLKLLLV